MAENESREILIDFIDESIESLNSIDALLIQLESAPDDMEIVNAIFRPFHSLKGNAAYFELLQVKKASHTLENLLDALRKGSLHAEKHIVDAILQGQDLLRGMLESIRNDGPEVPSEQNFNTAVGSVDKILEKGSCSDIDAVAVSELLKELESKASVQIESEIRSLKALLEPLTSKADSMRKDKVNEKVTNSEQTGAVSSLLAAIENKEPGEAREKQIRESLQTLKEIYSHNEGREKINNAEDILETFAGADTGVDELAVSMILEELKNLPPSPQDENTTTPGEEGLRSSSQQTKETHGKTMRISEEALDAFLKHVGELLGIEEIFHHLTREAATAGLNKDFTKLLKQTVSQLEHTSKELRTKIMTTRQVQANILLQKSQRIVRDIAAQTDKTISVTIQGEDIHIDKSYIELLDSPLTHMVRNAADHGIESRSIRVQNDKPEQGTINITLAEKDDQLQLSIADDGAGLNYEALSMKAVEAGLIKPGEKMSRESVINTLFASGVSTAEKITDISGRGVGMDVVRKSVEQAGGKITVESERGKGSTFTITLPRNASTQIMDGYVVRSFEGQEYVLPLNLIVEAFAPRPEDITSVAGKGRMVTRRGMVYPFIRIDSILEDVDRKNPVYGSEMAVLLDVSGKIVALSVREAVGIQKIVKKAIKGDFMNRTAFEGASVSGTGRVTLLIGEETLKQTVS
ncbi:MAG: chemotaxis protein CheA [Chitinispirillaceae bacterium]